MGVLTVARRRRYEAISVIYCATLGDVPETAAQYTLAVIGYAKAGVEYVQIEERWACRYLPPDPLRARPGGA